jgi:hypothetical protein
LRGSVGTRTEEEESSIGPIWAAGFHHVSARSGLARVFKLMNLYLFNFPNFFSGRGKLWIRGSACTLFLVHWRLLFSSLSG